MKKQQTPVIGILDRRFRYIPAATHGDSQGFRTRQELRRLIAQRKLLERRT